MSRLSCAAAALATVLLGLTSRRWPVLGSMPGDVLYATLLYFLLRTLSPRARREHVALIALALSISVEVSQLWHPAWLDALRATRLGGLALGHTFLPSDLACYVVGALLPLAVERACFAQGHCNSKQRASLPSKPQVLQ